MVRGLSEWDRTLALAPPASAGLPRLAAGSFISRELFHPFVRSMIATSTPGEQRQGGEKIAGNVVKEHITRRCTRN